MRNVPFGVTVLGIYYVAKGLVTLSLGGLMLLGIVGYQPPLFELGGMTGVFMLVFGLLQVLVGWGLYNFRLWAWFLALVSNAVSIPLALISSDILTATINAVIAVYLFLQRGSYLVVTPPSNMPVLKTPVAGHFIRIRGFQDYKYVRRKKRG